MCDSGNQLRKRRNAENEDTSKIQWSRNSPRWLTVFIVLGLSWVLETKLPAYDLSHDQLRIEAFAVNKMGDNPAIRPCPQEDVDGDGRWMSIVSEGLSTLESTAHERFLSDVKEKEPEVVFIGDSHIALLEHTDIYKELFAPMHALCLGIRGDTTANVLWRIHNGELEFIKPKVIVLLIGTNNRNQTPQQIVEGIRAVAMEISKKQPQAALFVCKIPPRGEKPNSKRELLVNVNAGLQQALHNVPNCRILDIDAGFIGADGTIDRHDMYDFLHLTPLGYRKAFEIVHVAVTSVLNPDTV